MHELMYVHVQYHKRQFYALAFNGSVGGLHINSSNPCVELLNGLNSTLIIGFIWSQVRAFFYFLIFASLKDPYDVCMNRTLGFDVYELGLEETGEYKKNPIKVESLGDRVIFLGENSSMVVMASLFLGFKGNPIYFTDDYMESCCFESQRFRHGG